MYWFLFIVICIIIFLIVYKLSTKFRDKLETKKVIRLSLNRKNSNNVPKQVCSFCRKRSKKLSFYSAEYGRVVGVCDKCKPQAERRALMRL